MPNDAVCAEITRLLRIQRHDFLNHLQVIHGMLQLGRTEKALAYIENIAKDDTLLGDIIKMYDANNCRK